MRRWRFTRIEPTRDRLLRAGLALALAAAVVAVAFGAGYRSSGLLLGDGAAYVQKGHRVVHVNAASGDADARAARDLATGRQTLEVVQVGPQSVYVVNHATGEVSRLPTDSLDAQRVDSRPSAAPRLAVATGGGQTYLLDPDRGTVTLMPGAEGGQRADVATPAKVDQLAVDGSGTAWAYAGATGDLYEIRGSSVRSRRHAVPPGDSATLTLVDGQPVVYDAATGTATRFAGDGHDSVNLAVTGGTAVAAEPRTPAGTSGGTVVVAVPRTAEVVAGNLATGDVRRVRLPGREGHQFGAPVVNGGRIYLPDFTARHVLVLDLATLAVQSYVPVPGTSPQFQVFARDDRVWVNDPFARTLISFDGSGRGTEVDKGTGDGVDPQRLPGDPAPSATSPAPASPSAGPRPSTSDTLPPVVTPAPSPTRSPPPPRKVPVPDVVGMDRAQACARLGPDLRCVPVAVPNGAGKTNVVLSTDPKAGTGVPVGSTVTVFYRGPATVPELTGPPPKPGTPVDQACAALRTAQLNCAVQYAGLAPDAGRVGLVTAQQPAAGASVATGTTVTLTAPDRVRTPDLAGRQVSAACAAVVAIGMTCAPVDLGVGSPAGVVVDQAPAANAGADPKQPVTVRFYGTAPVAVPSIVGAGPAAACGALQSAGLVCAPSDSEVTRDVNVVHSQSIAPGTAVRPGTAVGYTYQDTAPVTLHRYKAPAPGRANFIGTGGGPAGWSTQSDLGGVYGTGGGVPGLVPVYEFCWSACGAGTATYYFSANPNPSAGYVVAGAAFSCFNPGAAQPPGTRPLHAWFNGTVWVWAVPGSGEAATFAGAGFTDRFLVCFIW